MTSHAETIAALATPSGTSAIAVIRVSGPAASMIAFSLCAGTLPPRWARRADYKSITGELIDSVLLVWFKGPKSYTGEDVLEISCHGNPFIAQKILADLFARGCKPAGPGEFTQRAFLNGKLDLTQAEAVMDLIRASSDRALAAANHQLRGDLGRRMEGLIATLLSVLAKIEAYIDFPEEDLPPEDNVWIARELEHLARETDRLLATSRYGELLRDGIKTVIVGAPNVGKSSLLNRLIGRERALVSPEPGTTRDFIEERIVLGPHCLRIIDTAGLNPSPAPLEKLGMEKTIERLAEADLCLIVLDAARPVAAGLSDVISQIRSWKHAIVVLNKSDLAPAALRPAEIPMNAGVVRISALTGGGFEDLTAAIIALADGSQNESRRDSVAINARHAQALDEARECLRHAREKLVTNESVELLASDLRGTLAAYGEIAGKVDNERMLDRLFAAFCIGK